MKNIKKNTSVTVRGECDGWQKNVVEITLCKVVSMETASR